MLRCTVEAADRGRNKLPATIWPQQSGRDNCRGFLSHIARPYGGNQINKRTKCYGAHHDPVRGAAVRHDGNQRCIAAQDGGRSVTRALHCRPNATRQGQKRLPT
jgi:hypothetical protein